MVAQTPPIIADGRYELLHPVGQGGMATVYVAHDNVLDIQRAIKVLAPALSNKEKIRARFLGEARAMARIRHPNIVTVHDVGMDKNTPFIVMEMLYGGTVRGYVEKAGPQPPAVAGSFIAGTLKGLQASHDQKVIHRDIKPDNMLLTRDGRVKLTDFGIAQIVNTNHFTRTGASMGTLAYMPPEQRVSAKNLDRTADLYAAGASLYAILTGKEPFDLYNEALHDRIFEGVDDPLRELIIKSCQYEPLDRFASASSMLSALERTLLDMGVNISETAELDSAYLADGQAMEDKDEVFNTQFSHFEDEEPVPMGDPADLPEPPGAAPSSVGADANTPAAPPPPAAPPTNESSNTPNPMFTNHDWFDGDSEESEDAAEAVAPPQAEPVLHIPANDGNSFLYEGPEEPAEKADTETKKKSPVLWVALAAVAAAVATGVFVLGGPGDKAEGLDSPPTPAVAPPSGLAEPSAPSNDAKEPSLAEAVAKDEAEEKARAAAEAETLAQAAREARVRDVKSMKASKARTSVEAAAKDEAKTATPKPVAAPVATPPPPPEPARAPAPPAEEAPAAPASLSVRTIPQSAIIVNGSEVAFGVLRAHTLSPGSHQLEFRTRDGRNHKRTITVKAKQKAMVCYNFDQEGGPGDCRR